MTFLFDVSSVLECNKCLEVRQKAQALQMEAVNGRDKGHVVLCAAAAIFYLKFLIALCTR